MLNTINIWSWWKIHVENVMWELNQLWLTLNAECDSDSADGDTINGLFLTHSEFNGLMIF